MNPEQFDPERVSALLTSIGATDTATAEALVGALAAQAKTGRALLEALDADDEQSAIATIGRLRSAAREGATLRADLDAEKRVAIVRAAVVAGRLAPPQAWALDADGMPDPELGVAPLFADRAPDELEGIIRSVASPMALLAAPPKPTKADGLTARQRKIAAETGVDPEQFAALVGRKEVL